MYHLNRYSWGLIFIYFIVATTMEYFSYRVSLENIFLTLPLIGALIFWSQKTTLLNRKADSFMTKLEIFYRDLFVVCVGFICGYFLSLLFQYDNSDTLGVWPFAIYFSAILGLLLACVFSLIAMILNEHKRYTFVFSSFLMLWLIISSFLAYHKPFSVFARDETFYAALFFLIGIHLLICLGYRIMIFFRHSNQK